MYIFWVISGIIFLILDFIKKSEIKLTLAITSLFSSVIVYKFPEKPYLSFVLAPLLFVVFKLLISNILKNEAEENAKNNNLKEFKGKFATVTKDIGKSFSIDGIGKINFNGAIWDAKNITDKEIKAGKEVEIVSKENLVLNVKIKEEK